MIQIREELCFKNARILFLNFSGKEKKINGKIINEEGQRNFCVIIPEDVVEVDEETGEILQTLPEALNEEGWNINVLTPRDEGDTPGYYMQVKVLYKNNIPPKIFLITGDCIMLMNEDTVGELDYADIDTVDHLIIRPYHWESHDGSTGIAGYVDKMYVTIHEDP